MSTKPVTLYDTTLRDGTQGTGISFSVLDKIRVAEKLDAFGIDYIEGGWPGSNPKDAAFFEQAAEREWKHAKIAPFDIINAEGVQFLCHANLIQHREGDSGALRAVTQGGVVQRDSLRAHGKRRTG